MSAAVPLRLPESVRTGALAEAADRFDVADPRDLERASLQRRYDRKFILRADRAASVLATVGDDYRVVLAGDERFARYDTMYFDTPSLRCYHDHRRGRRPRYKVRIRNYLDRALSMLEYKEKTGRGDTRKLRWRRPCLDATLSAADEARLREGAPGLFAEEALVPQARTVFYRLMIISKHSVERATLDFQLVFERGDARATLDALTVAEVKDCGRGAASPLVSALRGAQARVLPFSKYCVAIALLGHERANAFMPSLRAIEGGF